MTFLGREYISTHIAVFVGNFRDNFFLVHIVDENIFRIVHHQVVRFGDGIGHVVKAPVIPHIDGFTGAEKFCIIGFNGIFKTQCALFILFDEHRIGKPAFLQAIRRQYQ